MATYPAKSGGDFVKAPEGTHLAICTLIADVGLQPGSGQFPDPKVKIYMRWEIPAERVEIDGKDLPQIIYNNYTASMGSKANLRKAVESWRGKAMTDSEAELFDVRKLLGQTCMLQVVHSPDGQYANVKNVMAPPKGTKALKAEGPTVYYGTDDDAAYDALPAFLRKKIDEQLDPHVAKPPPPVNGSGKAAPKAGGIRRGDDPDEQEASRAQARADAKGDVPEFDDEIPF
jgi:hypothetical protein